MVTNRRIIDGSGADFFPTPPWATKALMIFEHFEGTIWEPACGDGSMARVLAETYTVYPTDLYDRGWGLPYMDFLETRIVHHNIVTNPPYNLAEEFVHHALDMATNKVCLLLRLSFLESAKRYNSIFRTQPPTRVRVFSERITFYPNGIKTGGSGTTSYAWFIWDKAAKSNKTELLWFPPGLKGTS
jgi:hypothetical protein